MANFCSNCGATLSGDAKFCPECGTQLSNSNSEFTSGYQTTPTRTQTSITREKKVYFQGKIGDLYCTINSVNWYISNNKIIPVTSVSSVSYEPEVAGGCCGVISVIFVTAFLFSSNGNLVEIIGGAILLIMGILTIVAYLNKGEIVVNTNSSESVKIPCTKQEAKKCLEAMNLCLQENR